jgi:hypothetical protein
MSKLIPPLAPWAWDKYLDPNDEDRPFLMEGIQNGFKIIPEGQRLPPAKVLNYRSCFSTDARPAISAQIAHELQQHRYIDLGKMAPKRVHAMAAIPKKNSSKIRIISDCSRPHGKATNDFIPQHPFRYSSLDDVFGLITPGCHMSVLDFQEAFRAVRIHPSQWQYFGLYWEGHYYLDTRMCFGLKNAPYLYDRIGRAIIRILRRHGIHKVVLYVDDLIIVGNNKEDCQHLTDAATWVLEELGISINKVKAQTGQRVSYLGVEIDSVAMEARLEEKKVADVLREITTVRQMRKVSKRTLQSLAGKLNWVCKVVYGGRTFLRRILDVMNTLRAPHHRVRLTKALQADLDWWLEFFPRFNGKTDLLFQRRSLDIPFSTDASNVGYGGVYGVDWFSGWWPPELQGVHINGKEIYPILVAARTWGRLWRGRRVIVQTDNIATMYAINKGTTKIRDAMTWLRELFALSVEFDFHITAQHIPGINNTLADLLSRFKLTQFLSLHRSASPSWRGLCVSSTSVQQQHPHQLSSPSPDLPSLLSSSASKGLTGRNNDSPPLHRLSPPLFTPQHGTPVSNWSDSSAYPSRLRRPPARQSPPSTRPARFTEGEGRIT